MHTPDTSPVCALWSKVQKFVMDSLSSQKSRHKVQNALMDSHEKC